MSFWKQVKAYLAKLFSAADDYAKDPNNRKGRR